MKIYIDNEEVLCNSKMIIKEQTKNTSSVILNNVYPKSWETTKDYVSNFYMPKDYAHCKIIDEKITSKTDYDLTNNIYELENRIIGWNSDNTKLIIKYSAGSKITAINLIPNKKYKINITNNLTYSIHLRETDKTDINSEISTIDETIAVGTSDIEITPTKKILLFNKTNATINSITTESDDNLIFSGIVKNSGNIELNPRYPHYSTLQILDYKAFLSEGDTLNYVLESQSISGAIKRIIRNLDGFMVGEINLDSDDIIAAYNCGDKTAFDVLEYLAEITNSIWFTKAITEDLVLINFYSEGNLPQKDKIKYTTQYFETNNITNIKYSYSAKDYRNKQVIISDKASSGTTQVEYITYNGNNLQTIYPIDKIVSITSGNSNYSVLPLTAKQTGSYATFYYTYDSNQIDVNRSFETQKIFRVEYYSVVTTRQAVYNDNEINRIAESTKRNGTIARYEKRTDTTDNDALFKIAQSYLNYKGTPEITLTITTYNNDILNISDKVFFEGPLEDLTTNYLVIEKQTEMVTTGNQQELFYTYRLSSSFNDETAINFFDNQRRKQGGNIEEGEYITRYIDLPSETNIIFYDLSLEDIPIPNDVLDGELDVELIGGAENMLNAKLNFKI